MSATATPMIAAVGWALVNFVWQGAIVWFGAALAMAALRHARPQVRYAVACLALACCLAWPIAQAIATASAARQPGVLSFGATRNAATRHDGRLRQGIDVATRIAGAVETTAGLRQAQGVLSLPTDASSVGDALRASIASHLPLVVLLWSAGTFLLALRLAYGLAWAARLGRLAVPATSVWSARLADLTRRMGIGRAAGLKVSAVIDTPMTVGWWRPVVLLPAALLGNMSPGLLEALLAHELAHIRRHDYLVNLLQTSAEVLLFYHPAVWSLSRRVRVEREQIADDLAAEALGEPRRLALALQQLDLHQVAAFRLAQAANGGMLMNRIRRLVGPDPRPFAWKATIYVLALSIICAASIAISVHAGTADQPVPATAVPSVVPGAEPVARVVSSSRPASRLAHSAGVQQSQAEVVTGQWTVKAESGKPDSVQLQLRTNDGHHNWGTTVPVAELTGFQRGLLAKDGPVQFEVRRAAGTFACDGRFEHGQGSGQFRFTPNADYVAAMKTLGYPRLSGSEIFSLAMTDITPQFVRDMNAAGYKDIALDKLIELGIHGATPQFAGEMRNLLGAEVTIDKLVEMRIHGVTTDFARQVQGLFGKSATVDKLVEMRIHGATIEFAREMQNQFGKTTTIDHLIELRIHGATPDAVRQMRAALGALTVDQAVELRIHGVTPEYVSAMQQAYGKTVTADRLVDLQIHGVTTEYAAKMHLLVAKDVTIDQLVSFRIHGVSPEFVTSMKDVGYSQVTADQLVEMRIHGVDAAFAKNARQNGKLPTVEDLIAMKIHGRSR